MTHKPQGGDELSNLIQRAENEVSAQARRQNKPGEQRSMLKPVTCTLLVIAAVYAAYSVWSALAPPSEDQVARDLEIAVQAARESVEKAKSETGQLPEALWPSGYSARPTNWGFLVGPKATLASESSVTWSPAIGTRICLPLGAQL